jgi:hypothetical protein
MSVLYEVKSCASDMRSLRYYSSEDVWNIHCAYIFLSKIPVKGLHGLSPLLHPLHKGVQLLPKYYHLPNNLTSF